MQPKDVAEQLRKLAQEVEANVVMSWPIELCNLPDELRHLAAELEK
jgi:hypothetical protein